MKFALALALLLTGFAAHAEEAAPATSSTFATPLAAGHWQIFWT